MKTAIYIEDGVVQLVLTPESDFEKSAMSGFMEGEIKAEMFSGSFYDCRGGWVRQSSHYQEHQFHQKHDDKSLILKIKEDGKGD